MISNMTFPQRSYLFAQLASIAYSNDVKDVKKQAKALGFTEVEFYDKKGAQAYRFQNKEDLVIACRGTEPTKFNDIAADLKAAPVKSETVGRVHHGFKAEVDELWPMIKEDLLAAGKTRKAWFTGHSLGAAMTTIMASRCEDDPTMPNVQEVYTYGSPRAGWPKFVKALSCTHHRWKNNNDIVTTVPPFFMGYKHDGIEHYLNCWGNVREATGWQKFKDQMRGLAKGIKEGKIDSFSDHSMVNYCAYLKNFAEGKENPQN